MKNKSVDKGNKNKETHTPPLAFQVIDFGIKSKIYIGICILLFVIGVLSKLHVSSIPIWNQVANDGGSLKRGLVLGTPRSIRSDEWLVGSPFIASQYKMGFPTENESLGAGKSPLLFGLPCYHFISFFKPNFWGYFFLDEERAFAWVWNFEIFSFLIFVFLALMVLTRNNFFLSFLGTLLLFLASGTQWWFSTALPYLIMAWSALIFLFASFLYSKNKISIIVSAIGLCYMAIYFLLFLYPPFQIPIIYLFFFVIIGYMINVKEWVLIKTELIVKIVAVVVIIGILGLVFITFYNEVKDTIDIMTKTVYPGLRNEVGGGGFTANAFSEYFSIFINSEKFPPQWSNICELSHFLTFFPGFLLIVPVMLIKKRGDALIISLFIFQIICYIWMIVGFYPIIAKITLFYMCPSYRVMSILGMSNLLILIIYLSGSNFILLSNSLWGKLVIIVMTIAFLIATGLYINSKTSNFFTTNQIAMVVVLFTVLYYLLLFKDENKHFPYILCIGLVIFSIPNIATNPVSIGLKPIRANNLSKVALSIYEKEPKAGWAVFGQFTYSNFLKASGINVFGGVKFVPPLEQLKVLDPYGKKDSIYNRYAHISFYPFIDGKDSVVFSLLQSDAYAIQMDPCSKKLLQIGIRYIFFTYQPQQAEIRCMTPLFTQGPFIYRIND